MNGECQRVLQQCDQAGLGAMGCDEDALRCSRYKRRLQAWLKCLYPSSPTSRTFLLIVSGLHRLTILGLLQPCLILGKGRIITSAGSVAKFETPFSPPTPPSEAFTLLAFWVVVAWKGQLDRSARARGGS
jgi:hypothetical protein